MARITLDPRSWPSVLQGLVFFGLLFLAGYSWTHPSVLRREIVLPTDRPEVQFQVAQQETVDPKVLWSIIGAQDTIIIQDQFGKVAYEGPPSRIRDSLVVWQKEDVVLTWDNIITRLRR